MSTRLEPQRSTLNPEFGCLHGEPFLLEPGQPWPFAVPPGPGLVCVFIWVVSFKSLVILVCLFVFKSGTLKMPMRNQLYVHGLSLLTDWLYYGLFGPGPGCFVGHSRFSKEESASLCLEDLSFLNYVFCVILLLSPSLFLHCIAQTLCCLC